MFQKDSKIITVDTLLSIGKLDTVHANNKINTNIMESKVGIFNDDILKIKKENNLTKLPSKLYEKRQRGADIIWVDDVS
jgi:hypothetical protein